MSSHSLGNGYVEGCFLLYTIRKNAIARPILHSERNAMRLIEVPETREENTGNRGIPGLDRPQ